MAALHPVGLLALQRQVPVGAELDGPLLLRRGPLLLAAVAAEGLVRLRCYPEVAAVGPLPAG